MISTAIIISVARISSSTSSSVVVMFERVVTILVAALIVSVSFRPLNVTVMLFA